jgi:hypothetical protein
VDPEAVFLAGYALVLVAVAAGLESLGRRSADPWSSRVLAASRPPDRPQPDEQPHGQADWPHSEVPGFHLGVSGVVLAAALVLTMVSVVRNHRPVELVVQLFLLALVAVRIAGVARRVGARGRS